MESAVMTSTLMSSRSAGSYQQMRREVKEMKRRRAKESADGLALMTWFSVDDVIGDVIIISRWFESSSRKRNQQVACTSSHKLLFTSRCYLEIAIAKRCRLHKLIRKRFVLALKIQQMLFALISSSRKIPAGQPDASNSSIQSKRNAPAGFTITMQLLIFNEEVQLLILTRKDAPAEFMKAMHLLKYASAEYASAEFMKAMHLLKYASAEFMKAMHLLKYKNGMHLLNFTNATAEYQ
ncbi:hypothetical protein F511_14598 [Dorcoceras hygrometricum]|uniref:Uncharacterized protein n=1 Tax=Dorcoceras hygrometricum TaxID=472368 RepID=A0A2Z7CRR7_9LAMI|nr:hypothetical protein F511_14598 [Dorcoceras hygrometricum]